MLNRRNDRGRGRGQPPEDENEDMATMMANMQRRLDEQARIIEQQAAIIQNFQQHRAGPENQGDAIPHGNENEGEGPQPPEIKLEPLYERFCKMKSAEFEGSTNPLDAEEWLSSIQTIMDFLDLNDPKRVLCASYMLKR